jgi:hypothetical protein
VADDASPPSSDASFRAAVVRHLASGVGLVVVVAVVFWAIGSFGGDDDGDPAAADGPATEVGRELEAQLEGDDEQSGEPAADDGTNDADAGADDAGDDADGESAATADDDDGDDADQANTEDEDEADEPDPEPGPPAIDPATISVQVLDGYQEDGGAAANAVAEQLTDEGYDIVARNPALRYDVTTVLWTAGFEDEGRQVAAAIGAAEAREQPGNLSGSVAVHVVVGADRG